MKVLHVAETIQGGIASYLEDINEAQSLEFSTVNVVFLIPWEQRGFVPSLSTVQLRFFRRQTRNARSLWALFAMSWRTLSEERPDLVHIHSSFAGLATRMAIALRMLTGRPRPAVVYCAHGWAFTRRTSGLLNCVYAAIERMCSVITDRIINISRWENAEAVRYGLPRIKCVVIYNGVGELYGRAAKHLSHSNTKKFLFVGRLDRQKGFDILVDAVRATKSPSFFIDVVGGGVLDTAEVCNCFPLPECMRWLQWVPRAQLKRYYRAADAIVVPSRWEGFGLVVIEAMSCGTPVVASRVGALPEIVEDGVSGFLFDIESPSELASILQEFDKEEFARLRSGARRRYEERFTAARMNAEILALYEKLLGKQMVRRHQRIVD